MKYFSLLLINLFFIAELKAQCCPVFSPDYPLVFGSEVNYGQFTVCGDQINICGTLGQEYINKYPIPGTQNTLENPIAFEFRAGESDFYADFNIVGQGQIFSYELEFACNDIFSAISEENIHFKSELVSGYQAVIFEAHKIYLVIIDGVDGFPISYTVKSGEKTLEYQKWNNNYSIEGPDIVSTGSSANYSISLTNNPTLGEFCGKTGPCCGDFVTCISETDDLVYEWTGPNGSVITPTNASGSEISLIMGSESGELCCRIYDPVSQCIDIKICKYIQAGVYFNYEMCPGEIVYHNGVGYDLPGTYYDFSGPATEIITVSYYPVMDLFNTLDICSGDDLMIEGISFHPSQDTTVIFSKINSFGCEELNTYQLHLNFPEIHEQKFTICEGDSVLIEGLYYSADANFTKKETTVNDNGCFDLTNYIVFVIPEITSDFPVTLAPGAVFDYNGTILSNEGIFSFNFTSIFGCDSTVNVIVNFSQPIINYHEYYWCEGQTINYNGNTYNSPGKYAIKTYPNNQLLIIDSIIISHLDPQLKIVNTTISQTEFNLNAVIQNTDLSSIPVTYLWSFENIMISDQSSVIASASGWYYCEITFDDENISCSFTDSVFISPLPPLNFTNFNYDKIKCPDQPVHIDITANADQLVITEIQNLLFLENPVMPLSAKYENSDITITARIFNSATPDTYKDSTFIIKLDVIENHPFDVEFGTILSDNKFEIGANNSTISDIKWSPSELFDCNTCPSTIVEALESRYIYIEGRNENNCHIKDSLWLRVETITEEVFIPNAFTPNNDGFNDEILPDLPHNFQSIDLKIFDRWGQLIFNSNGRTSWNGNAHGKPADSGVYVYTFKYKDQHNRERFAKGSISLIR